MRSLQNLTGLQSPTQSKSGVTFGSYITGLSGLIAYYPLNETTGNAINQAPTTRGSLDGTPTGVTPGATGKVGKAYSFDGFGDFISVADAASLDFANALSIVALVNITSANLYPSILTKQSGNTGYEFYFDNASQKLALKIGITSASTVLLSTSTLSFGTWVLVGATYDKTNLKVFINGTQDASVGETNTVADSTSALSIGGIGGGFPDGNYSGLMQHVSLFNQALTAPQMLQLARLAGVA